MSMYTRKSGIDGRRARKSGIQTHCAKELKLCSIVLIVQIKSCRFLWNCFTCVYVRVCICMCKNWQQFQEIINTQRLNKLIGNQIH